MNIEQQIAIALVAFVMRAFPVAFALWVCNAPEWATYGISLVVFIISDGQMKISQQIKDSK